MKQGIPISLKIVAWLFILGGTLNLIDMLRSLDTNHININLGVINIFAGIGLLKLRSGWRFFCLIVIWIGLIITPIVIIGVMSAATSINFTFFGQKVGFLSKSFALMYGALIYALTIWEYRVLNRPDVKELFTRGNTIPATPKVPDDSEPVDLDSFPSSWNPYFGSNYFKEGESLNSASIKRQDTENI